MPDIFRTIILPIADGASAKQIAAMFPNVGPEMFTSRLSATGKEPATHVISSGLIPVDFTDAIPVKKYETDRQGALVVKETLAGTASKITATVSKTDATFTDQKASTLMAKMDVSDQPPFEAMARLGLMLVQPDDPMGVKAEEVVKGK